MEKHRERDGHEQGTGMRLREEDFLPEELRSLQDQQRDEGSAGPTAGTERRRTGGGGQMEGSQRMEDREEDRWKAEERQREEERQDGGFEDLQISDNHLLLCHKLGQYLQNAGQLQKRQEASTHKGH